MSRRHVFESAMTSRGERQSRCKRCGVTRMFVATLKSDHTLVRLLGLYRKAGGESWMTYYPRCAA